MICQMTRNRDWLIDCIVSFTSVPQECVYSSLAKDSSPCHNDVENVIEPTFLVLQNSHRFEAVTSLPLPQ